MKRSPLPPRKTPLRKSGPTKAKKVLRQKAFYASAAWKQLRKEALERAGHQCGYLFKVELPNVTGYTCAGFVMANWHGQPLTATIRCPETDHLHVHHKTNVRFGGDERPEDLVVYCKAHHELVEARDFPYRQRKSA